MVCQDFPISPTDRESDCKEKQKGKEYLVSTERTFQLKNSRLLYKTTLTLERGKLKEKAKHAINEARTSTALPGQGPQTPQNRPNETPLDSERRSDSPGLPKPISNRQEPARGPCLSFPICK